MSDSVRENDLPFLSLSFLIGKMGFKISAAGVAVKGGAACRSPGTVSGAAGVLKKAPVFGSIDRHGDKASSPGQ